MESINKKFAFFDFCDTLVGFQSADAFVDYVRRKKGNLRMRILEFLLVSLNKTRVIALFDKLLPGILAAKRIKLFQLRGLGYANLDSFAESFYLDMIRPGLIETVIKEMKRREKEDYEVCLVSAGYSIYLKYFAEEHHIKHLISTEIAFNSQHNRCLGAISGRDCIHDEKVIRLKSYLRGQNVNYQDSISYSDSMTDLPLLQMTGKGVVISRGTSQAWINKYNFEEIIWNKK